MPEWGGMKILVTGATGFIGRRLVEEAKRRGHSVVAVSRDPASARSVLTGVPLYPWNPEHDPLPHEALDGTDVVVHLAGESVGEGRWTKKKMARIRDSRVLSTRKMVEGFARKRPKALVNASAIGWYGDRGDELLREDAPAADDFLAGVCREWEAEALKARELGVRVACVRTGVVLGRGGGALAKMLTPFKLNMGGRLGSGEQWMSWVHLDDIAEIFLHAAERDSISGPVNGTAPNPRTNVEFTKALGRALGKWTFLPMPAFMLRLVVGKFAEVLLASQKCDPAVARQTGYAFKHPELEGAFQAIFAPPPASPGRPS